MTPLQALLAVCWAFMLAAPAGADGGRLMPVQPPAAYLQECGSCHLAYPPGLLPAASWQRLMGGLGQHYGSDAAIDAALQQQLTRWLVAHAGTARRVSEAPPQDRITRSAWFERKHREIDASVWRLPSVKSAANCAACHGGAERGVFEDEQLKLPAGLPPHLRRPWND